MPNNATLPPKPTSRVLRPELVRLPQLTFGRRVFRSILRLAARLVLSILTDCRLEGLENIPKQGPMVVVINHLGDTEGVLGLAYAPVFAEAFAKIELFDYPIVGKLMHIYGFVWVHRGQPDRRALRAALQALEEKRLFAVAPEGRQSVSGGLEPGTGGAAYLALKAGCPVLPVTFTGTQNQNVYGHLKRLRRPHITMRVGHPFVLPQQAGRKQTIEQSTEIIMRKLAEQLPSEYRGVYTEFKEERQIDV